MALSSSSVKPFSPDEAFRLVHELTQPAVFLHMSEDWPVLRWTVEHLSHCLGDKTLRFRLGRREETHTPLFETQCCFVNATPGQFLRWTEGQTRTEDVGALCDYKKEEHWAYADYKYIAEVFEEQPSVFEEVRWSDFGFRGRDGRDSTLWVGTHGAHTPCHCDSYGCNLVLQVQGRKRWHLFPPEDRSKLYPTRIPYEESSVFSRVDVLNPDLGQFKDFSEVREHCVTLEPGQVLFVPRHWWHHVESVDPVTVSVNSWIELEVDDEARVGEAVARAVVCAFKTAPGEDSVDDWLNPTEVRVTSPSENMQYLNLALSSLSQRRLSSSSNQPLHPAGTAPPHKRHFPGQVTPRDPSQPLRPPFGPHLVPVKCRPPGEHRGEASKRRRTGEEAEVDEGEGPADEGGAGRVLGVALSTNDLLDCLLHPDVVERVTELLVQRHTDAGRTHCSWSLH